MDQTILQTLAKQYKLQVLNVDGKDFLVGKTDDFYKIAEEHHLRINILMKDENKQQDWKVLPYFTFDGLSIESIVCNYMNDYDVISFGNDYKQCAKVYVDNFVVRGASPTEIDKAISDTKAIMRMFDDKKLGYGCDYGLVMDNFCTEHHIVPNSCRSMVSFKGITLAVALSIPTLEETELAFKLVMAGKPVPCLNGMLPEDLYASYGEVFCRCSEIDRYKSLGRFLVIDVDDILGFAYRCSSDEEHWYWVGGHNQNHDAMKDEVFNKYRNSANCLSDESKNNNFLFWEKIDCYECDKYGTMIELPTL